MHVKAYFDGGARPSNPGPTQAAAVVIDANGETIAHGCRTEGTGTNNLAEWSGLQLALELALEAGATSIEVNGDSNHVINCAFNGHTVQRDSLKPFAARVKELLNEFEIANGKHVRRAFNAAADTICNRFYEKRYLKPNAPSDGSGITISFVIELLVNASGTASTKDRNALKKLVLAAATKAFPVAQVNVARTETEDYLWHDKVVISYVADVAITHKAASDAELRAGLRKRLHDALEAQFPNTRLRVIRVSG